MADPEVIALAAADEASSWLSDGMAARDETLSEDTEERQQDAIMRQLFAPIESELQVLKSTSQEAHGDEYMQLLNRRLLPVGEFIVKTVDCLPEHDSRSLEWKCW